MLSYDRRRRVVNGIYIGLASVCFLIALIPLVSILYFTGSQGIGSLNLQFFTRVTADYDPLTGRGGGILNAVQGSFLMVGIAASFGVPLGIFAGAYMAEYPGRFSSVVRLLGDALTGVPSIITGIFVSGLLVITTHHFSAGAGGFALGTMMVPIVAVSTQEALRLVPSEIREGGLALGLSKSRVLLQVLLSTAKKGVATGVILALARVMGETAPILLTDLGFGYLAKGVNSQAGSLTLVVWSFALSGDPAAIRFAWGAALVLVLIVLGLNILVRLVSRQRLAANQ